MNKESLESSDISYIDYFVSTYKNISFQGHNSSVDWWALGILSTGKYFSPKLKYF